MRKIRQIKRNVAIDGKYIYCPVCGGKLERIAVCQNCNWENNGDIEIDGGPNKMTLEEAKKAYAEGRLID